MFFFGLARNIDRSSQEPTEGDRGADREEENTCMYTYVIYIYVYICVFVSCVHFILIVRILIINVFLFLIFL